MFRLTQIHTYSVPKIKVAFKMQFVRLTHTRYTPVYQNAKLHFYRTRTGLDTKDYPTYATYPE